MQRYPEVEKINHVHHAGNSSGIVDGAAAILIGTKEFGEKAGLKPRARIRSFASIGSEPAIMLTGPAPASEKALKRAGMTVKDIDLWELNEAFAAVVLRYLQVLKMPHDKINVNGGAIAMGHPLGATGAMILGTLLDEMERRNLSTGLATLCVGGRHGHRAPIIERVCGACSRRYDHDQLQRRQRRHRHHHLGHAGPHDERAERGLDHGLHRRARRARSRTTRSRASS